MNIEPAVLYTGIKTALLTGGAYYFFGPVAALWVIVVSAVVYSLAALNGIIRLEQELSAREPRARFD